MASAAAEKRESIMTDEKEMHRRAMVFLAMIRVYDSVLGADPRNLIGYWEHLGSPYPRAQLDAAKMLIRHYPTFAEELLGLVTTQPQIALETQE
jgi:hypothetical protein